MTARHRRSKAEGPADTLRGAGESTHRAPEQRRRTRLAATITIGLLLIGLLIWQRDRFTGLPEALLSAQWLFVALAVAAQAVSMAALALEQRRLLAIGGHPVPLPSVMATVYAGTAISVSLPMIGSATAAVFSFRRFVGTGVDAAVAAWALAISGVYSTVTLAIISSIGALIIASPVTAISGALTLLFGVLPVTIFLATIHRPRMRAALEHLGAVTLLRVERKLGWPGRKFRVGLIRVIDRFATLQLTRRSAVLAAGSAFTNWLADIACLTLSLMAVHAMVPWTDLILIWAVGVGISALGLTPGGIGVVELTLCAGLVAAGLPASTALAGVVIYRAVKLWLVVLTGGIVLLAINLRTRGPRPDPSASPVAAPGRAVT